MSNEKNKIEALLFAAAKWLTLLEISEVTGITDNFQLTSALSELKADYENRGNAIMLAEQNGRYKLALKDHYLPMVRRVMTQTELDKPLMETLAVIAWKYPILQAQVIKIRHNKAYEHLKILEEMGFITRIKFGRTNKLTLTQKFFEYFDLPSKEQVQEVFKNVVPDDIKKRLEQEEKEIEEGEQKIIAAEEANKEQQEIAEQLEKSSESSQEIKPVAKEETPNEIKQDIAQLEQKEEAQIQQIQKDEQDLQAQEEKREY